MKKWGLGILTFVFIFAATYYIKDLDPQYSSSQELSSRLPSSRHITDMHTHVACMPPEDGRFHNEECFISQKMMNGLKFPIYLKALGVTVQELKDTNNEIVFQKLASKLDESIRVKRAVVLAVDAAFDRETGEFDEKTSEFYVPNSFILKGVKKYSDKFLYGASINPYRKDALELLDRAKSDGAVVVKWIPCIMNIDPADKKLIPFYQKLVEHNIPLLSHTGKESTFTKSEDSLCDPARLKLPLDQGVKIIAAHIATSGENEGEPDYQRLIKLFAEEKYRKTLVADISATTQLNRVKDFKKLISNPVFRGRLLYGSDWPLIETTVGFLSLTPYKAYTTPIFNSVLTVDQVTEIAKFPSNFDKDVKLKESLGASPQIFLQAEEFLGIGETR